jgi:hypothetical protein
MLKSKQQSIGSTNSGRKRQKNCFCCAESLVLTQHPGQSESLLLLLLQKRAPCTQKKVTMHHPKLLDSRVALVIILSCLFAGGVLAAIIRVPADQPTIQQAIDVANPGDLILVSPGTYFENIDYHGKAISVRSARGPAQTIIDGSSVGPVVTFQTGEGLQSALTGFTIQHGNAPFGAGVTFSFASATITRNVFRNNAQGAADLARRLAGIALRQSSSVTHSWLTLATRSSFRA